jgi:hypothetical protein
MHKRSSSETQRRDLRSPNAHDTSTEGGVAGTQTTSADRFLAVRTLATRTLAARFLANRTLATLSYSLLNDRFEPAEHLFEREVG